LLDLFPESALPIPLLIPLLSPPTASEHGALVTTSHKIHLPMNQAFTIPL